MLGQSRSVDDIALMAHLVRRLGSLQTRQIRNEEYLFAQGLAFTFRAVSKREGDHLMWNRAVDSAVGWNSRPQFAGESRAA